MTPYHKINTMYKRDVSGKIMENFWSQVEFSYLADCDWMFTEKVDGTNIRVMWDGDTVRFGGKTDNAQLPAPLVARLQERFPDGSKFKTAFGDGSACLYGEGYGARIQKGGGNYRPDQDFVLFDVKIGDWWLLRSDVEDVASHLGLDVVPVVGVGTLFDGITLVRRYLKSIWGNFEAEGIVARPLVELRARNGDRIITKIKARDFN
jgi:hypothetical protein